MCYLGCRHLIGRTFVVDVKHGSTGMSRDVCERNIHDLSLYDTFVHGSDGLYVLTLDACLDSVVHELVVVSLDLRTKVSIK